MRFTSDNAREFGRRGGQTTASRYGSEHMARIGRAGFLALARRFGYVGGSRRGAVQHLQGLGRLAGPGPYLSPEHLAALFRSVGLGD
jgi:hypothetical protein